MGNRSRRPGQGRAPSRASTSPTCPAVFSRFLQSRSVFRPWTAGLARRDFSARRCHLIPPCKSSWCVWRIRPVPRPVFRPVDRGAKTAPKRLIASLRAAARSVRCSDHSGRFRLRSEAPAKNAKTPPQHIAATGSGRVSIVRAALGDAAHGTTARMDKPDRQTVQRELLATGQRLIDTAAALADRLASIIAVAQLDRTTNAGGVSGHEGMLRGFGRAGNAKTPGRHAPRGFGRTDRR